MERILSRSGPGTVGGSGFSARKILARLLSLDAVYRQRRALAEMDDERLADIGLDRDTVDAEVKRPVWNAPQQFVRPW